MASSASIPSSPSRGVPVWDMNQHEIDAWLRSTKILHPPSSQDPPPEVGAKLTQNIFIAVASLLSAKKAAAVTAAAATNGAPKNGDSSAGPPNKKIKTEQPPPPAVEDKFGIWVHNAEDEVPATVGAILVQLSLAGWINALAGHQPGGIVTRKLQPLLPDLQLSTPIPTAANATYQSIRKYAIALKQKMQTQMERDFLTTTPKRIHEMVCGDLTDSEFQTVRRRVYETVILGRGVSQPSPEDEDESLAVARNKNAEQASDQYQKCKICGNNDQSLFVVDRKNGDVICTNCGTIAMESLMHEGQQYRKFEGEIDRNHHGDMRNSLYSDAHNLSTTLGGIQVTTGAGMGGYGSGGKKGMEVVLRNAHSYTELNLSNFGKGDRRTRIGYKDRQKREAFMMMTHVGDALNLHEAVIQRAKELFAGFRDDRELVVQFKGVVGACLAEAFEQLSRDGHQILKQREQDEGEALLNSRASRRSELHHANMAGKGGLLLDTSPDTESNGNNGPEKPLTPTSAVEKKPAATWDLDDCRSWLLEASRSIAQQWLEDRNKPNAPKNIPQGTLEELEGKLVEHTISLCDQLEAELKSRDSTASGLNKRVITPRVNEMGKLGIKWQHSHERGSGGAGGVGQSGKGAAGPKPGATSGRTAGQILLLKTSKKLGAMLKDPIAGEALHKELRGLVGRQEARKRNEMREEATRQRLNQMKRKPWLQAKAQETSS